MDYLKSLYPEIREVLEKSIPNCFPELRFFLRKLFEEPMISEAILPLAACQAVNGEAKNAVHVCAALLALGVCLRILDDLEDQDRPDSCGNRLDLQGLGIMLVLCIFFPLKY
jgi:geranylgeranyl diphosphate synthase type I